jgi:hypothetical protein
LLDQRLPAEDREHRRKYRRADEQPAHHRGGLGGEEHRLLGALPVERARVEREDEAPAAPTAADSVAVVMPNRITARTMTVRMPSGATDVVSSLTSSKRSPVMRQ